MAEKSYNDERRDVVKEAAKMQSGPTESTTFSMTPNTSGGTDTRTVIERDAPIATHRKQAAKEAVEYGKKKKAKKKEESEESEEQVQTADFEPTKVDADTVTDDDKARLEAHLSGSIGRDISDTIDAVDIVGTAGMAAVGGAVGALGNALLPILKSRKAHGSFSKPIVDPNIKGMEADKRRLGKQRAAVGREVAGIKQNQRNIDVGSNVLEGVKDTMKGA